MSNPFRTRKWGEEIDSADAHVRYLESVQARWPGKPNFRGDELRQAKTYADELRRQINARGKRRSDSFYGLSPDV